MASGNALKYIDIGLNMNIISFPFQSKKESRKGVVFMEVFEAIRTVLAVRRFKDTPIPGPIVREIVEAGHLTASGGNRQPWHFIVGQNKRKLLQLAQLATTGPQNVTSPIALVGVYNA